METKLFFQFIGSGGFIALGLLLILGAIRKWKLIVDPPDYLWPFYTQALFKKVLGRKELLVQTYIVGICCLGAGIYYLMKAIANLTS